MKHLAPPLVLALLTLPLPARAVLLDCEIDARRVYTCIEVGPGGGAAGTPDAAPAYGDAYSGYVEQARQQCVYEEPRRRAAGKNTGIALRTEELKVAKRKYGDCIGTTARELWLRDNPPGADEQAR
jgi:hypothetical protein